MTKEQNREFRPHPGQSIEGACAEAILIAKLKGDPVCFNFNGVNMVATEDCETTGLVIEWRRKSDAQAEAWRKSPEGIKAAEEAEERKAEAIRETNSLLAMIDAVLVGGMDKTMEWLKRFSRAADHIGADFDKERLIAKFEAAGYVENDFVGSPLFEAGLAGRLEMGRYIAGQAIARMRHGMPPHPMTANFVDRYNAIPA